MAKQSPAKIKKLRGEAMRAAAARKAAREQKKIAKDEERKATKEAKLANKKNLYLQYD